MEQSHVSYVRYDMVLDKPLVKSLPSPGGGPTYFRRLVKDQASLKRFRESVLSRAASVHDDRDDGKRMSH